MLLHSPRLPIDYYDLAAVTGLYMAISLELIVVWLRIVSEASRFSLTVSGHCLFDNRHFIDGQREPRPCPRHRANSRGSHAPLLLLARREGCRSRVWLVGLE